MNQVIENRVARRRRHQLAKLVTVVVLLLIASVAPVVDAVPHESTPEELSSSRWPIVTRIAELLW